VLGVKVTRVDPTGAAHQVLRRGYVIMEVNRKPTPTVADYQRIVNAARPGDVLAIYYYNPQLALRSLVTVVVD
jgi:S1-C subfamily serine protease